MILPAKHLHMRAAASIGAGDDIVEAIAVHIAHRNEHATGESRVISEEAPDLVTGCCVKDAYMRSTARTGCCHDNFLRRTLRKSGCHPNAASKGRRVSLEPERFF